jgi:two-component system, OmpR family, KDP operon response regulator KdpE
MERRRVLVIEDDPDLQGMLEETLEFAGYDVTVADSALGAMATVRRLHPGAILLDLGLPYRSGASLLDELKASNDTAGVPVLVVSANTHTLSAEQRAMTAAIIPKPFDVEDLIKAVEAACAAEA